MNNRIRGFIKGFLLLSCLTAFSPVYAFAADAGSGPPDMENFKPGDIHPPAGAGSGSIEDPDAAAGVLNDFCKERVKIAGRFSDEEAAQLREILFEGQYSDKMPVGTRELPVEVMDRFIKEVMRCAVTADTVRLMQNSDNKSKAGAGVR